MALREVYEDAIRTCDKSLYSQEQIEAWSALAYLPGILDKPLKQGAVSYTHLRDHETRNDLV